MTISLKLEEAKGGTYGAEVVLSLGSVGKAAVGCGILSEAINAAGAPGDLGATELLDANDATKSPEVTIRDPRELLLDLLHAVAGNVQTVVGAMESFRLKAHGGVVAAASVGLLVVGTARVPCETNIDGSVRAVYRGQ